jgi:hypothetical protein
MRRKFDIVILIALAAIVVLGTASIFADALEAPQAQNLNLRLVPGSYIEVWCADGLMAWEPAPNGLTMYLECNEHPEAYPAAYLPHIDNR